MAIGLAERGEAQNLVQQRNQKWLLALLLLLSVCLSGGCGKDTHGRTYYRQIAEFLPANTAFEEADYTMEQLDELVISHSWILHTNAYAEPEFVVVITTNPSGEIEGYATIFAQRGFLEEHPLTAAQAQQVADDCLQTFAGWETLPLQLVEAEQASQGELGERPEELCYVADSADGSYHYQITVQQRYGYVSSYDSSYCNPQLRQQALDWLAAEERALYSEDYEVLGVSADDVQEYRSGDTYTITLRQQIRYQNKGIPEDDARLQWIAINKPEEYRAMYDAYDQAQENSLPLKLVAEVQDDGTLDLEYCALYGRDYDAEGHEIWTQIPGLSVYVGNGQTDMPGWFEDLE